MTPEELQGVENRVERLSKLGIYTAASLKKAIEHQARQTFVIDDLLRSRSVNLLVGDSGLGKTPLAMQMALCVAAGTPFFGWKVRQGPVLYCDAESGQPEFYETLQILSRTLGLSEPPPDFHVWSPYWEAESLVRPEGGYGSHQDVMLSRVREANASFVIIDPFRAFFPGAEAKNSDAALAIDAMKRLRSVTWLIIHHRRKTDIGFTPDLVDDHSAWFQQVAGAHALVNHTDTRLGVIPHPGQADLLLAGFVRRTGKLAPLDLLRVFDEEGTATGYRLSKGVEYLNATDRKVFESLSSRFRFRDVEVAQGGNSPSNADRLLKKCIQLELIRKDGVVYAKRTPDDGVHGSNGVNEPGNSIYSTDSMPGGPTGNVAEQPTHPLQTGLRGQDVADGLV
ncbi:MAG: AAA family ATPase [Vicinamibacterales bacterium]